MNTFFLTLKLQLGRHDQEAILCQTVVSIFMLRQCENQHSVAVGEQGSKANPSNVSSREIDMLSGEMQKDQYFPQE